MWDHRFEHTLGLSILARASQLRFVVGVGERLLGGLKAPLIRVGVDVLPGIEQLLQSAMFTLRWRVLLSTYPRAAPRRLQHDRRVPELLDK